MMTNRFTAALSALPSPGGNGYHTAILGVANLGAHAGYSRDYVAYMIRSHTPIGNRSVPDQEIIDAVNKAFEEISPMKKQFNYTQTTKSQFAFDVSTFMSKLQMKAMEIEEADIWEASPVRINWEPEQDAVELLTRLYQPEDVIFCGDRFDKTVKTAHEWIADFKAGKPIPPHIAPNPITGLPAPTKNGEQSYRCDAAVKSFRFAVAEFDSIPREEQVRFWWSINLPLCALIDSGGKSIHAWIKIDGVNTAEQWDTSVEGILFRQYLTPLGVDSACKNEARLSRLPGHFRNEKKKWQRLLYLCPEGRAVSCRQ